RRAGRGEAGMRVLDRHGRPAGWQLEVGIGHGVSSFVISGWRQPSRSKGRIGKSAVVARERAQPRAVLVPPTGAKHGESTQETGVHGEDAPPNSETGEPRRPPR